MPVTVFPAVSARSVLKKHGFAFAAAVHIPLQEIATTGNLPCNQCAAPFWIDKLQHRVLLIARFIRKINSSNEMSQQSPHENAHIQMRRLQSSADAGNSP